MSAGRKAAFIAAGTQTIVVNAPESSPSSKTVGETGSALACKAPKSVIGACQVASHSHDVFVLDDSDDDDEYFRSSSSASAQNFSMPFPTARFSPAEPAAYTSEGDAQDDEEGSDDDFESPPKRPKARPNGD